jgi:HK97 family phage major capsid protein
MIEEVKKLAEETLKVFNEFKIRNDKDMEDVKKGKYVPKDILESTEKHNKAIDELQGKMEKMTAAMNRETTAGKEDDKADEAKAKEISEAWFRGKSLNEEEYKHLGKSLVDKNGNLYATPEELKQLNVGTDSEGGYFVRPFFARVKTA